VDAVLYRYRAGIPWCDLPERFGDWKHVHRRFSHWAAGGVWERGFAARSSDAANEYAMIDATIVRALWGARMLVALDTGAEHKAPRTQ
jgi:transposase